MASKTKKTVGLVLILFVVAYLIGYSVGKSALPIKMRIMSLGHTGVGCKDTDGFSISRPSGHTASDSRPDSFSATAAVESGHEVFIF